MNFISHKLLNTEEIKLIKNNLGKEDLDWEDGRKTAGKQASLVKNNLQLKKESKVAQKLSSLIIKKMLRDDLIKSFALPKKFMVVCLHNLM